MPNRVYESMTRVEVGGFVVRVWMPETTFTMGPNQLVLEALKDLGAAAYPKEIVALLDAIKPAAFEILDGDGNGGLVYPDWS